MQKVTLHALPESEQPWTIEEFVEKNEEICRMAAVDLHRKSTMVEEAVEEVLQLVRKAIDSFKSTANSQQFDFLTGEGNALSIIDHYPDSTRTPEGHPKDVRDGLWGYPVNIRRMSGMDFREYPVNIQRTSKMDFGNIL